MRRRDPDSRPRTSSLVGLFFLGLVAVAFSLVMRVLVAMRLPVAMRITVPMPVKHTGLLPGMAVAGSSQHQQGSSGGGKGKAANHGER